MAFMELSDHCLPLQSDANELHRLVNEDLLRLGPGLKKVGCADNNTAVPDTG